MNYQINTYAIKAGAKPLSGLSSSFKVSNSNVPKRMFDVAVSLIALAVLMPLMAFLALLIKLQDKGPAIYKQQRIGKDGKQFYCLKFRSMVMNSDQALRNLLEKDPRAAAEWQQDQKLKNDPRITNLGEFIRKTSLDELPQLWNIIKGDMSLVGPRPIVMDEVSKYGPYFDYYTAVKPGVTGLWQVSGRNDTTYEERVQLDVEYARGASFWTDIKIIFKTIPAVLLSKGAY